MPTSNRTVGITLVVIGVLILLGQMGVDFFGWLWPILLCVIGGFLLWSWYTRGDDSGKVFSGALLILLAFFFLFLRNDRVDMARHWPFFVLAPGISLLVMSRVDRTRRDASVPGWIAIAAALVLYFFTSGLFMGLMGFIFGLIGLVLRLLVPLALVALGGWMLFNHRRGEDTVRQAVPEKYEPAPASWSPEMEDPADEAADDDATELDISVGPIPAVGGEDEDSGPEEPEGYPAPDYDDYDEDTEDDRRWVDDEVDDGGDGEEPRS
jgi:hypothetical protein